MTCTLDSRSCSCSNSHFNNLPKVEKLKKKDFKNTPQNIERERANLKFIGKTRAVSYKHIYI